MRARECVIVATAALAAAVTSAIRADLAAQASDPVALSGVVRSREEGAMEGSS